MKRVVEPYRRCLLDEVKKNLRAANLITHITRLVYIGNYIGTNFELEKRVKSVVRHLQVEHTNILISGLLLVYPDYFVHILEASEWIIYQHVKNLVESNDEFCKIDKTVFLPSYHHVYQRFFTEWSHIFLTPPSLFEIPTSYDVNNIKTQVTNCLTKVYRLCVEISNISRDGSVPLADVVNSVSNISRVLPESTVIEYLLNAQSPVLLSFEEYLRLHNEVPFMNFYQDTIWPPTRDFMFDDCGKDRSEAIDSTILNQ